jgi:hypothetical protein
LDGLREGVDRGTVLIRFFFFLSSFGQHERGVAWFCMMHFITSSLVEVGIKLYVDYRLDKTRRDKGQLNLHDNPVAAKPNSGHACIQ